MPPAMMHSRCATLPLETARDLLHRLGDDPAKLEREIHRLKSSG
jgi:hypothetical protein